MEMKPEKEQRPDGDLVVASRRGDRNAYAALIHRYAGRVFAVCRGILGNTADSEDMAQETFMKGLNNITGLRDGDHFSTWITQIARNACRDFLKTGKRRRELLDRRFAEDRADHQDYVVLYEVLGRLQEQHRLPLTLYYLDGRNIQSVAEELGVSEAAAYTRLSRARRALRLMMEEVEPK